MVIPTPPKPWIRTGISPEFGRVYAVQAFIRIKGNSIRVGIVSAAQARREAKRATRDEIYRRRMEKLA